MNPEQPMGAPAPQAPMASGAANPFAPQPAADMAAQPMMPGVAEKPKKKGLLIGIICAAVALVAGGVLFLLLVVFKDGGIPKEDYAASQRTAESLVAKLEGAAQRIQSEVETAAESFGDFMGEQDTLVDYKGFIEFSVDRIMAPFDEVISEIEADLNTLSSQTAIKDDEEANKLYNTLRDSARGYIGDLRATQNLYKLYVPAMYAAFSMFSFISDDPEAWEVGIGLIGAAGEMLLETNISDEDATRAAQSTGEFFVCMAGVLVEHFGGMEYEDLEDLLMIECGDSTDIEDIMNEENMDPTNIDSSKVVGDAKALVSYLKGKAE
jgi:hypothetical protein